jgi:hypothetical protein
MTQGESFATPDDYDSWAYVIQCIKGPEPRDAHGNPGNVPQPLFRHVRFDGHIPGMVSPGPVKVRMLGCAQSGYKLRVREHGVLPQQSTLAILPEESRMTGEPFTLGVVAVMDQVPPFRSMISEHELNQPQGHGTGMVVEREMLPLERIEFCNFLFAVAARSPLHVIEQQPFIPSRFDVA